tara:strand:+ start:19892 stop:20395 length:504 start_codon:yes stop_codon:yes gene_type:complete
MGYRDDDRDDARAEARAERARTSYRYNCGGASSWSGPCGASDCGSCRNGPAPWEEEEEDDEDEDEDGETAQTDALHIAARDYAYTGGKRIDKGDLYERITGFTYVDGGERTGYLNPERRLVARSPANGGDADAWASGMLRRESQLKRRRILARSARVSRRLDRRPRP